MYKKIDKAILDTNMVICKSLSKFDDSERGLLSQIILQQLRNFVEYIAEKIYANNNDIDPNDYEMKKKAISYIKTRGDYRFLLKFHSFLQKSASHYTLDENGSERLMLKYYEYLLKIKSFMLKKYSMEILENIEDFPLDTDPHFTEYYQAISERIVTIRQHNVRPDYAGRFYVQKVKPFFIDKHVYYEVTFTDAIDNASKFNRIIAFTDQEMSDYYAVYLTIKRVNIEVMDKFMPIQVITSWQVSVRPCEFRNFIRIFGDDVIVDSGSKEYQNLMYFLTDTKMNLVELIDLPERIYSATRQKVLQSARVVKIFVALDKCRELSRKNMSGQNIMRYVLFHLNNVVEKDQYSKENCKLLSNLHLKWGCIPFDTMPFATSPIKHNVRVSDLLECIESESREHEFLARRVSNNTMYNDKLFTPLNELGMFEDIHRLATEFNKRLYKNHKGRELCIYKEHIYIREYAENCKQIIKELQKLSTAGIKGYPESMKRWLEETTHNIKGEEKKSALIHMYQHTHVALIYGAAGTGKTTLIN